MDYYDEEGAEARVYDTQRHRELAYDRDTTSRLYRRMSWWGHKRNRGQKQSKRFSHDSIRFAACEIEPFNATHYKKEEPWTS